MNKKLPDGSLVIEVGDLGKITTKELPEHVEFIHKKLEEEEAVRLAAETKKSFPLRPSAALQLEVDLYYDLQRYYGDKEEQGEMLEGRVLDLLSLGHALEDRVFNLLSKKYNIANTNFRLEYGSIIDDKDGSVIPLSGEADVLLQDKDTGELLIGDSKTSSRYAFDQTLPKEDHFAQINLYMHSPWARENKVNRAIIAYYCKDNCNMRLFIFEYNEKLALKTIEKFQRVHSAFRSGKEPTVSSFWGGQSWRPQYSRYKNEIHEKFNADVADREVIEIESLDKDLMLKENNFKKAIDVLAAKYGNKIVVDKSNRKLFLRLTKRGLNIIVKQSDGFTSL